MQALAQVLQKFSDEPDLASDLGRAALQNAREKYGPAAHHAELLAIYQAVVGEADRTGLANEATINAGF